jgi:hypothetical protein
VNGTNVTGATNVSYSYVPANNDAVSCVLTSNTTCATGNPATSNTVTMTVNPILRVSVAIAASANPVCSGTSVTFTATPTNGGTSPAYQWIVNGNNVAGATNVSYSYETVNGDNVYCVLTSNVICPTQNQATSNTINMTVNPNLPVSVSIVASANPVPAGTSVTFNATANNGGSSPVFTWMVNGINISGATSSSYTFTPSDGDIITCSLLSNAICAINNPAVSNEVLMLAAGIPAELVLQNINITETICYNAIETITVAGPGSTFTVQNNGNVTMIAGQRIKYLQGTRVIPGGYMHGYITSNSQFCGAKSPSIGAVAVGIPINPVTATEHFFKVYPNPTDGHFILELKNAANRELIRIEMYNITGEKIFSKVTSDVGKQILTLSGNPAGIYLIKVVSENHTGTARILKRQ